MPVQIVYNQEFDVEHYPIQDWHREQIQKICDNQKYPINTICSYDATIHGRIFAIKAVTNNSARLNFEFMKFLVENIQGLRWIESTNGDLIVALKHVKPEQK